MFGFLKNLSLVLCSASFLASTVYAVQANTLISNSVTMDFKVDGYDFSANSNVVSFYVDEVIAFTLIANNPSGVLTQSPQAKVPLSFTLTNQGNGNEKFLLSGGQSVVDDFDATLPRIYIDINNNNIYDDTIDVLHIPGVNDPILAPGFFLNVFIVSDIMPGISAGDESRLALTVDSETGPGIVGAIFLGAGDGGVDAVMGFQGSSLTVENRYVVTSAIATIAKSQQINDPFGGNNPVKDAEITYQLALNVTGSGTLSNLVVRDIIPNGTQYKLGSLRFDGVPLTDAVDLDPGVFNGAQVNVSVPAVAAPATHVVEFKVRIL